MRESESTSDACGDGMADDALATQLQVAPEVGACALQAEAQRRLKEKGGCDDNERPCRLAGEPVFPSPFSRGNILAQSQKTSSAKS